MFVPSLTYCKLHHLTCFSPFTMKNRQSREETSVRGDNSRHCGYAQHVFAHNKPFAPLMTHRICRLNQTKRRLETERERSSSGTISCINMRALAQSQHRGNRQHEPTRERRRCYRWCLHWTAFSSLLPHCPVPLRCLGSAS